MKIVKNTSGYDTRALRALIISAHNHIRKYEGAPAPNWKTLRVLVRGRDSGPHVTGRAYLRGRGRVWDVCLTLPRPVLGAREMFSLAHHELMHTYGYRHHSYVDLGPAELAQIIPADYQIPTPAPRPKASPADRKTKRIVSLIARQKRWQSALKRAQTALKKISKSLRHYERNEPVLLATYREKR